MLKCIGQRQVVLWLGSTLPGLPCCSQQLQCLCRAVSVWEFLGLLLLTKLLHLYALATLELPHARAGLCLTEGSAALVHDLWPTLLAL